jgi:hypothetical protein
MRFVVLAETPDPPLTADAITAFVDPVSSAKKLFAAVSHTDTRTDAAVAETGLNQHANVNGSAVAHAVALVKY